MKLGKFCNNFSLFIHLPARPVYVCRAPWAPRQLRLFRSVPAAVLGGLLVVDQRCKREHAWGTELIDQIGGGLALYYASYLRHRDCGRSHALRTVCRYSYGGSFHEHNTSFAPKSEAMILSPPLLVNVRMHSWDMYVRRRGIPRVCERESIFDL